ncbi:WD40 repeat domain-containing protein [Nostoc sp.]|uniref:WD40 repeat domain-containing protein n=1 Tax=Nostoc sp. TaxID=1180 RepID=UPI002FF8C839
MFCSPVGKNLPKGDQHWIKAIAFSPEGQRLVSPSFDQTVKLWDVHTGVWVCFRLKLDRGRDVNFKSFGGGRGEFRLFNDCQLSLNWKKVNLRKF